MAEANVVSSSGGFFLAAKIISCEKLGEVFLPELNSCLFVLKRSYLLVLGTGWWKMLHSVWKNSL